jgi:dipeptidase E
MKKYLSSFKLWSKTETLKKIFWENKKIGLIPNARFLEKWYSEKAKFSAEKSLEELEKLWLKAEILDLSDYFWKEKELEKKLLEFAWAYVTWWNVFVLNQAYELSGFGNILQKFNKERKDFVYIAYSAGVCVLSSNLDWYQIVDDSNYFPYPKIQEQVWEWVWLINFNFSPHYDSNHPESKLIDEEIKYCINNKILFKAVRDWEVLIYE